MSARTRTRLPAGERRTQLLELASSLIAQTGFHAFSLDTLASAAGVTKGNVIYHFGSKQQLLLDLLAFRDELDSAVVIGGIPDPDHPDARAILDAIVRRNIKQPEILRLYAVLSGESLDPAHPAHDLFEQRLRVTTEKLALMLEGFGRPAINVAIEVVSFMDGLQMNWLRDPTIDMWAQWTQYADTLFASRQEQIADL